jgi:aminoglycoside phosphotransferase (APT) family kinase protein
MRYEPGSFELPTPPGHACHVQWGRAGPSGRKPQRWMPSSHQPVSLRIRRALARAECQVSTTALRAIAERHHLSADTFARQPEVGIFNAIYLLGDDWVVRVPRQHPGHLSALRKEAVAVPAARAAGVRTPRCVAFDEACDLLPVPYAIYERVHGETLGLLQLDIQETPDAWRALGHDLALLHTGVPEASPAGGLTVEAMPDPRASAERLAGEGFFTVVEAHWLIGWLDTLALAALAPGWRRFIHNDVQATNIMVAAGSHEYLALLDWGSSGWGDPAWDFVGMPLRAVPLILEGYRAVVPLDADETAEARITWRQLQIALMLAKRPPQPERSWGERPLGMLLDILRFFADAPSARWRDASWPAPAFGLA